LLPLQKLIGIPAGKDPKDETDERCIGATPEETAEKLAQFQILIDEAEPLTEEEVAQKELLEKDGFFDWSKRDFQQFMKGIEKHGKYVEPKWSSHSTADDEFVGLTMRRSPRRLTTKQRAQMRSKNMPRSSGNEKTN
jgi:hypothetical protein